ncbi:NAD(P)-dependent oxidoreductase [Streptomyces sp. NPDC003038]|uniref:NAD-dependent epimerase/dehydratase family protein n=1 Tax=unclassified Streptomyces TaxID=2593676 RepID=UPI0033ACB485
MTDHRVLITGASGVVGGLVCPRLRRPGRVLRLMDVVPPGDALLAGPAEVVVGSVTDPSAMREACAGVDAVIHLAGLSREDTWEEILEANVVGTRVVLEAARSAGVGRVVLASSGHAVGFRTTEEAGAEGLPADSSARPDTYYGFSKAAMEALGSLYHSRFGMDVICVRIGSCFSRPPGPHGLRTWLSPDDAGRLFEACLTAESPGFRIVWGVSRNTRNIYSLREAEELGYRPADDAEVFAADLLAGLDPQERADEVYVGGRYFTVTAELGVPMA